MAGHYTSFLSQPDEAEGSGTGSVNLPGAQAQTSPQAKRARPVPQGVPQGLPGGSPYTRTFDNDAAAGSPNKKTKQSYFSNTKAKAGASLAARKAAIPATLKDAGPHDRMLWQWKLDGKSYLVIGAEWEKLTGEKHDISFFSVRFVKMKQRFAANSALDLPNEYYEAHPEEMYLRELSDRPEQDNKLIELKEKADKLMETELWKITAQWWEQETGEQIEPGALHQRWKNVRGGDYHASPNEEAPEEPTQGDGGGEDVAMEGVEAADRDPPRATRSRSARGRASQPPPGRP